MARIVKWHVVVILQIAFVASSCGKKDKCPVGVTQRNGYLCLADNISYKGRSIIGRLRVEAVYKPYCADDDHEMRDPDTLDLDSYYIECGATENATHALQTVSNPSGLTDICTFALGSTLVNTQYREEGRVAVMSFRDPSDDEQTATEIPCQPHNSASGS